MAKVFRAIVIGALVAVGLAILLPIVGLGAPFVGLFGISNVLLSAAIGGGIIGGLSSLLAPSTDLRDVENRVRVTIDPNATMKWIFGETSLATDIIFAARHGDDNQFYTYIIAGAGHEIDSYGSLFINDELVTFSGDAATGDWTDTLWRQTNLGSTIQGAFVDIDAADDFAPGLWPITASGLGMAHYRLRWDVTQDQISSGVPTRITQIVKGGPVYDPRLDSTRGGSGAHRADDQSTWEYNDGSDDIGANWALIVLRYLIGWEINGKLVIGVGIDPDDIDMDQAMTAANVCEEVIDSKPRYRIGGILPVTNDHPAIIGELEGAINGKVSLVGGKYYIWAPNDDLTPFSSIGESDLIREAGVHFTPSGPMEQLYNTGRGSYVSSATTDLFQAVPYPDVEESAAITEDGNVRILNHDLAMIQDVSIAERVVRGIIRRSRFGATWRFALGPKGLTFQPFTVTTLNIQETNNANVTVRIIDMSYSISGAVIMEVIEEDSSIYDTSAALGTPITQLDPSGFDPTSQISVTGLAIGTFSVSGSTGTSSDGLKATWNDPGTFVASTDVQFRSAADTDWNDAPAAQTDFTQALIIPLEPGTLYDVRARHVTLAGVAGPWSQISDTLTTSTLEPVISVFVGAAYLRKATAPTTPVLDDGSYNFSSLILTPPSIGGGSADNWSATVPAGTDPLYVTHGSFAIIGSTGTDNTVLWTTPVILASGGGDGLSIHVANIYIRSASPPSTPSVDDGQYNFSTNVLTPPSSWSVEPPAGSDPLYVSTGSFSIVGQTGTDTTVTWTAPALLVQDGADGGTGDPGDPGDDGLSVYVANVYLRSASAPSTPSVDDGQYNFSTNVLTPPSSWSVDPPAGSDPLYVSTGSFSIVGQTGTDTTVTWTTPAILVQDGATGADGDDGLNNATVTLFHHNTSGGTPPSAFSGTFTYTFATGVLSGGTPNGWTQNAPTLIAGEYLWQRQATASAAAPTDSVPTGDFNTAQVVGIGGEDGSDGGQGDAGINSATVSLFHHNTDGGTPPSAFSGTFTYTFATGVLSGGTLNGWSQDAPTLVAGEYLWQRQATASANTPTDSVPTGDFNTAQVVGIGGTDGDDGGDGNSVFVGQVFLRKSTAPTEPIDDDGSYNFSTNVLTPPSTGGGSADDWFIAVPAGTDPLYVCQGTFEINGTTGTDNTVDWSAPVILATDGADGGTGPTGDDGETGAPGYSVSYVYDDLDTTGEATAPSRYALLTDRTDPTTGDQNDFQSTDGLLLNKADLAAAHDLEEYYGKLVVGDRVTYWISANRWYLYEIDELLGTTGSGSTLRFRFGVILIDFAEDSNSNISTAAGTPVKFQFNRVVDGNSVFVGQVFLRKSTAPTEPIDDDGSYNFTTNVLTPPSTGGGSADDWFVSVPAGSDPLYVCAGTFEINGIIGTDNTVDWTAPVILASDGADGTDGDDGDDGVLHYLTNEAHLIPANFDGTGYDTDFPGAGGTHKVFQGTTDETTNATHSVVGGATKNGLTMAIGSGNGVYSLSGTAWTTDVEVFTLRAVFNSVNYDKEYTIAKAKQGSDGGCALDTLTNVNLVRVVFNNTAVVGFQCHTDGTIDTKSGSGSPSYVNKETWIGACANSEYECRMNKDTGDTPAGSAIDSWLPCSTIQNWSLTQTSIGTMVFDGTFLIRRTSDDTVLKTVTVHLSAEFTT